MTMNLNRILDIITHNPPLPDESSRDYNKRCAAIARDALPEHHSDHDECHPDNPECDNFDNAQIQPRRDDDLYND